jgi:hypothetical protein
MTMEEKQLAMSARRPLLALQKLENTPPQL